MNKNNIYKNNPQVPEGEEYFEIIAKSKEILVEKIISNNITQSNWYDQEKEELVFLLKGEAEILFENNNIVKLSEGDYILIPRHLRHKVVKTTENCIWLTIHSNIELTT